jgi:hypothetical protein
VDNPIMGRSRLLVWRCVKGRYPQVPVSRPQASRRPI